MVMINGRVEGLKELARNSNKLKASFARSTLRTALRGAAAPVRKEARALAPKETGTLRRAIKSKARVSRDGYGMADVGVEKGPAFYGHFIELGTSQQPARPFLRPALDKAEQSGAIEEAFVAALNKTIARTLGRLRGG